MAMFSKFEERRHYLCSVIIIELFSVMRATKGNSFRGRYCASKEIIGRDAVNLKFKWMTHAVNTRRARALRKYSWLLKGGSNSYRATWRFNGAWRVLNQEQSQDRPALKISYL